MVANHPVSIKNKARIKDLLERLRNKLRGFAIINMQGQIVGRVKDLALDKSYHLNVWMSKNEDQADSTAYLLSSKYIEKVDTANRLIFVDIEPAELNQLPVFSLHNDQMADVAGNSPNRSATQVNTIDSADKQELNQTDASETQSLETDMYREVGNEDSTESEDSSKVLEEEIIRLLEERLVVNRRKQKVGEVVVRKEIEIQIVEVPIQREILIIEQVGSETKRLAEIDLSKGEVSGVELANVRHSDIHPLKESSPEKGYTVMGEFVSPRAASNLLDAIALQKRHGCVKVRVELVVDKPELQETYQNMFDRCSVRPING